MSLGKSGLDHLRQSLGCSSLTPSRAGTATESVPIDCGPARRLRRARRQRSSSGRASSLRSRGGICWAASSRSRTISYGRSLAFLMEDQKFIQHVVSSNTLSSTGCQAGTRRSGGVTSLPDAGYAEGWSRAQPVFTVFFRKLARIPIQSPTINNRGASPKRRPDGYLRHQHS